MPARTAVLGIAQEAGRFAHLRCRCSWPGRVAGQRWIFGAGLVRVSPRAGRSTRSGWPVQLAGQGGWPALDFRSRAGAGLAQGWSINALGLAGAAGRAGWLASAGFSEPGWCGSRPGLVDLRARAGRCSWPGWAAQAAGSSDPGAPSSCVPRNPPQVGLPARRDAGGAAARGGGHLMADPC